ncbi:MAG: DUF2298 domain-containing protein [Dehalococcoidia bacterium]
MADVLAWFLTVEILGALALPLTFLLFPRLPDRGYSLTKPVALVLTSYLLWVSGLTRLIPNSQLTLIVILAFGALISGWLLYRHREEIRSFLTSEWRTLLVTEVVFVAFFLLWLALVSEFPAINHTEKPMDFAFLNAVLESRFFPPEDPWLAGHPISYYYFGHFMMAALTQITATSPAVSYNLSISLIPALVATGAFGLLFNLIRLSGGGRGRAVGFALLAPVLLLLIGNLEGALEFLHAQGWGSEGFWQWVGVKGLEGTGGGQSSLFPDQTWWWWRATRVIDTLEAGQSLDYTITEFPFFSFVLGDLHPHVMSLPFLLLVLSLSLNTLLAEDRLGIDWLRRHPVESLAIALFLGSLAFINIWDFPVYAGILGLVLLLKSYRDEPSPPAGEANYALANSALRAALTLLPVVIVAVVLFLPFYRDLSSQATGILPVGAAGTRPFLFFLVIGFFFLLGLSFLLRQLPGLSRPEPADAPSILVMVIVALTPFLLWAAFALVLTTITDGLSPALKLVGTRLFWLLPGLGIVGLAGFSALQRIRLNREPVLAFPLLLLMVSFYLLVGAELFFVLDFFGNRMNTVFKVYYQSWLLLAVVGAYGLYYWHAQRPAQRVSLRVGHYAWTGVVVVLLLASLYYPVGAALDRSGLLRPGHTLADNTLDGLAYVQRTDPGEYAAVQWLREQDSNGGIVEAVGDDYSNFGRVSASTGRATILGWKGHEHQWRGTTTVFEGREPEVAEIYQSTDPRRVRELLERYNIRYVYLGKRERAKYGASSLAGLGDTLRTVFEQEGVIIYELIR